MRGENRSGETRRLKDMLSGDLGRIYREATPERRRAYDAARATKRVYEAYNAAMEHMRGRDHVTGLFYDAAGNRLVAYVDAPAWVQELSMAREVVRTRMSLAGADVAAVEFRPSKEGYARRMPHKHGAPTSAAGAAAAKEKQEPPRVPLTEGERSAVERQCSGVDDLALRQALEKAMIASFEWKKGQNLER